MNMDKCNVENSYLDLRPDIPVMEICDNRRVVIENHKGILCYGAKEIDIKVKTGHVLICGDRLSIVRMNRTKIVICGNLASVHIQKGKIND